MIRAATGTSGQRKPPFFPIVTHLSSSLRSREPITEASGCALSYVKGKNKAKEMVRYSHTPTLTSFAFTAGVLVAFFFSVAFKVLCYVLSVITSPASCTSVTHHQCNPDHLESLFLFLFLLSTLPSFSSSNYTSHPLALRILD